MPHIGDKALTLLRSLPRVTLGNIRDNPGARMCKKRGRGQHGGDKHGAGNKGSLARQNFGRIGYETGNNPFYLRPPNEPYYRGHHLLRQYPPLSMAQLQLMIDTDRLDISEPIDLVAIFNTGLYRIASDQNQFGLNLIAEGIDTFTAKINIEVQWASECVIAAIERAGGVITTAYYDQHSLQAMQNPSKFFQRGIPIVRRMLPPPDVMEYYTDPTKRGYLADQELISKERLVLAQKYGYKLAKIENYPNYNMFTKQKDPRQIFYGLEPGWVVNLREEYVLKPKTKELLEYYSS